MLENKDIESLGIEAVAKLENKEKVNIVHEVSQRIIDTYPNCRLEYEEIFNILFNTDMYRAKLPDGIATVNYYYKNSTIYFDVNSGINDINEFILHECLHRIEERRDKKEKIISIGLCGFDEFGLHRMALNEGAIHYMTVNILDKQYEKIKLYNVELRTKTKKYFPLITNLVTQIIYLTGKKEFEKNIFVNPLEFIYKCIDTFGENEFKVICINLDKILDLKEQFAQIMNSNKDGDINVKIQEISNEINLTFFATQNIIMKSYFNSVINRINTLSDVDNYRRKIFLYRNYIGKTKEYEVFYNEKIKALKEIEDKIKRRNMLLVVKNNIFVKLIGKIKSLLNITSDKISTK